MLHHQAEHSGAVESAVWANSAPTNELAQASLPPLERASTKIAQEVVALLEQHVELEPDIQLAALSRNVNKEHSEKLSVGQKLADKIAATMGSWYFIALQSSLIVGWMIINSLPGLPHWDANPFILLNLVMAFQAAYAAPVIMMSQNRQSAKDHLAADIDHEVNLRNSIQLQKILKRLDKLEQNPRRGEGKSRSH